MNTTIDGEPSVQEIIAELASGAFIELRDDGRYELRRPGKFISNHTMHYHLICGGWLENFANCGGYRLSNAGHRAYVRSTDELSNGELVQPAEAAGERVANSKSEYKRRVAMDDATQLLRELVDAADAASRASFAFNEELRRNPGKTFEFRVPSPEGLRVEAAWEAARTYLADAADAKVGGNG